VKGDFEFIAMSDVFDFVKGAIPVFVFETDRQKRTSSVFALEVSPGKVEKLFEMLKR
jgi:hypothetical protein